VRSNEPRLSSHCFAFKAMGTRCDIRVFAIDAEVAARSIFLAVTEINRLEEKYSRYRQGNFMSQLNRAADAGAAIDVDDECMSLLNFADACYVQSDGLFDISSGVLRKAWNFDGHSVPAAGVIERLLASVGWQHVRRTGNTVRFGVTGMELDFGGVVKEYAVDRAAQVCRQHGIVHGIVDMGGDIVVIGPDPDGQPWVIGIQHPRFPERTVASFALTGGALATSGDYARCIEIDGKRYSHILSPANGWPVQGLASVTVVSEQCVIAGSVCTTAMLKQSEGTAWLATLDLPHVWVDLDGQIGGTPQASKDGIQWMQT
jgi:thiamine biosynthesis lipoprotein